MGRNQAQTIRINELYCRQVCFLNFKGTLYCNFFYESVHRFFMSHGNLLVIIFCSHWYFLVINKN
jgi:hypothetical protein